MRKSLLFTSLRENTVVWSQLAAKEAGHYTFGCPHAHLKPGRVALLCKKEEELLGMTSSLSPHVTCWGRVRGRRKRWYRFICILSLIGRIEQFLEASSNPRRLVIMCPNIVTWLHQAAREVRKVST